jgi:hypothetical protein
MIRVCYLCKKVYGEKAPIEDRSISHGLCEDCVPLEAARIEEELRAMDRSQTIGVIRESPIHGEMR